jgi:anti-sigma-K factor RskA/putative zinc finger protein
MGCADVIDQLEGYALGALDRDEAAAVARHLAGCESCRRELRRYEDVAAALPAAVASASQLRLHPSLRNRVLLGLSRGRTPTASWPQHVWRSVAIAALVLLAASLVWGWQLNAELAHEHQVNAEMMGKLTRYQLTVFEVVDSPVTVKRGLKSTVDLSSNAPYGKVFSRTDQNDVVAMVNRLPQPPAGHIYQLWLTSDGQTTLAGPLEVDKDGFAYLVYRDSRIGPNYQQAIVTLQPLGGSTPSTNVVLIWQGSR